MKTKREYRTIEQLVDLSRAGMVKVNAEYQRGAVWNPGQQKKLIDSVMRGYQLPIIYLHYKEKTVAGMNSAVLRDHRWTTENNISSPFR